MSDQSLNELKKSVTLSWQLQLKTVDEWHKELAELKPPPKDQSGLELLKYLIMEEHRTNFQLWHHEDRARRTDVDEEIIAQCKHEIDSLNQKRNDLIEKVDLCLLSLLQPLLPSNASNRYNTETIGSAIDRLSILSLKIYHMEEQTKRQDSADALKKECEEKLRVLREQHADLSQSVLELLDDYGQGLKQPKVYYQFKMYNDPRLNPELYKAG